MPELPDVVVYIEALERRIFGQTLQRIHLASPFLLRSVDPPLSEAQGKKVLGLRRLGKRIVYAENETNYCARCQTGGKLLADRALSRLLKEDWPRTLEEMEAEKKAKI
jgi:formamidopyrimidine-DNA glycosylase